MATKPETPPPPPAADNAAPKKKRLKLFIIIGIAVVVLLGAAGAAVMVMTSPKDDEAAEEHEDTPKGKKKDETASAAPVYLAMETFTVNLLTESADQYLQLSVTLELGTQDAAERIRIFTPRLRNQIMLLLSGKKPSELASKEGKEKLAEEMKEEINAVITPASGKGKKADAPVKAVLFTSFIVQ